MYLHQGLIDNIILYSNCGCYKLQSMYTYKITRDNDDEDVLDIWCTYHKYPNVLNKIRYQLCYKIIIENDDYCGCAVCDACNNCGDVCAICDVCDYCNKCNMYIIKQTIENLQWKYIKGISCFTDEVLQEVLEYPVLFDLCIENGVIIDKDLLDDVACYGNPEIFIKCIDLSSECDNKTLSAACVLNNIENIKICLKYGIKPDIEDLQRVAFHGYTEEFKLFIEYGVVPDTRTINNAIFGNRIEITEICLQMDVKYDYNAIENASDEIKELVKKYKNSSN